MNEAIDRLIAERERMDAGLPGTLLVSIVGHLTLLGTVIALPALLSKPNALRVEDGFAVVLPRGGGGSPTAVVPPAAAPAPRPVESAAPPPAPRVLKPQAHEARPDALPAPDAKRTVRRLEPQVTGRPTAAASHSPTSSAGGTATPGLEFGPPGPGVPNGTDAGGDWYLAGVQQKIWLLWNQQMKTGFAQPIAVTFTIQPDGTVTNVKVTQPSGTVLLDMAAQRAVQNAAPFGPLPREYGENPRTIQALFRPTS